MLRLPLLFSTLALAAQGCIIYNEACEDCGWRGGFEDHGGWWGEDSDSDDAEDSEEAPVYSAALDPARIRAGEAVAVRLYLQGPVDPLEVTSARFSGQVSVTFLEPRPEAVLLLLEAPTEADSGFVDLTIEREEGAPLIFPELLEVVDPAAVSDEDSECG